MWAPQDTTQYVAAKSRNKDRGLQVAEQDVGAQDTQQDVVAKSQNNSISCTYLKYNQFKNPPSMRGNQKPNKNNS